MHIALELAGFLIDCGMRPSNAQAASIVQYFTQLGRRHRVAFIKQDNQFIAVCTFFLCERIEDIERYHQRPLWSTPVDAPTGSVCYMDKLVAKHWTLSLRHDLERHIRSAHPLLCWTAWYRPGHGTAPDRLVIRRLIQEPAYV